MTYRWLTSHKRTRARVSAMELIPLAIFIVVLAFVAWKTPSTSQR
jgi:hypothetical protein